MEIPNTGKSKRIIEAIRAQVYLLNRLLIAMVKWESGTDSPRHSGYSLGLDCYCHHSPHSTRASAVLY